jgi:hypothetical protein
MSPESRARIKVRDPHFTARKRPAPFSIIEMIARPKWLHGHRTSSSAPFNDWTSSPLLRALPHEALRIWPSVTVQNSRQSELNTLYGDLRSFRL